MFMASSIDQRTPHGANIIIQVASAYDLLRGLWLVAQPGAIPRWREWAEATAAALAPGDLRLARRWFKGNSAPGLAFDALTPLLPEPANGEQLLAALAHMTVPDFLRAVITADVIDPDAPLDAADLLSLTQRPPLAREFLDRYLHVSGHLRSHLLRVLAEPELARAELLGLLRRHHDQAFARLEPTLRQERTAAAERWRAGGLDHERMRALFAHYGSLDEFAPVVVAPSTLLDTQVSVYYQEIRHSLLDRQAYEPFILLVGAQRDRTPSLPATSPPHATRATRRLARGAMSGGAPGVSGQETAESVARAFEMLADTSRLRIVHLLAERPHYGQELAAALDVSTATITHHINLLLRAGVVSIERQSHRTYFALRRDLLLNQLDAALRYALGNTRVLLTPPSTAGKRFAEVGPEQSPSQEHRP
jgi:DNA-binding transcriptional ArsR family regulator